MADHPTLENLCFQGGGVRGSAYAGAVEVLAERGLLDGVRRIAGTSAGAITAAILATGNGSEGLTRAIRETDFSTFLDAPGGRYGGPLRLQWHLGMHEAATFVQILEHYLEQGAGNAGLTLWDLAVLAEEHPERYAALYVVASNLNTQEPVVLCAETFPHLPVAKAVRSSMSVPLLFDPVEIEGHLYVDGGLSWDYPIDLFDHPEPHSARPWDLGRIGRPPVDRSTLGFALQAPPRRTPDGALVKEPVPIEGLRDMLFAVANFMYASANRVHLRAADVERTVFIDPHGVSEREFGAPPEVIEAMIGWGREATEAFLDARDASPRASA